MNYFELGVVNGKLYRFGAVICANAETLCGWHDSTGNGNAEACGEIQLAVCNALEDSDNAFSPDFSSNFRDWNGGKYSTQAHTYGYQTRGWGVTGVEEISVELDDEGDYQHTEDPKCICVEDLPDEFRGRVEAAIEAACAAYAEACNRLMKEAEEEARHSNTDD